MKLLIPLSYLNEACFLSLNINEKKFKMVLKLAQESLRDILGAEFYEQIETQYAASGDTFSTENAALYEGYIKDFLAWQTYLFHLKFSQSDSTPTGEREFSDENSTVLADVKLFAKEKNISAQANHYRYKMINFIKLEQSKDATKYTLYNDTCKEEVSWGISSVSGKSDAAFKITKAVRDNE